MECDVCGKGLSSKTPLTCATCARTALYPLRIEHAKTLLERETFGKHVEALVKGTESTSGSGNISLSGALINRGEAVKKVELERTQAETIEAEERLKLITEQTEFLKRQIEESKKEIAARKAANSRRRSDLSSATHAVDARRTMELDAVKQAIAKRQYEWDRVHTKTVQDKTYLCRQAASLARLKQGIVKERDGTKRLIYHIGGIRIYDLPELYAAKPEHVTASLTHIARLVVLVSHYLGIRLPAEITLPHRDYPLPTIVTPQSSYQSREVPFPGSTPTQSSNNSPEASRSFDHHRPLQRPRPLYLDERRLPQLLREDSTAYNLFVEGVSLLAWDIAWLCRSQGMHAEFNEWEEICSIGMNLYRLLVNPQQPPSLHRELSTRSASGKATPTVASPAKRTSSTATPPAANRAIAFGQFSHGTAHSFLGAAGNSDFLRGWVFSTYARVTDNLKSTLLTAMQNAEWEVLEEREWDDMEDGIAGEPIVVGTERRGADMSAADGGRSALGGGATSARTLGSRGSLDGADQAKGRGVNGWTKLKSRNPEPPKEKGEV